jgi:microcin C transport system substrate-binding protein
MGLKSEAVDTLIEHVMNAQNKAELATSVKALDRTLRDYYFWVPQWFNDAYRVAYWDMYEHPETLPPFALGNLDFWWYNAEKAADLKAKGVLR